MSKHQFENGQIKGWIGFYSGNRVQGWITYKEDKEKKCKIKVIIGNYISSVIEANEYREHLVDKGYGDGRFGFSIDLPKTDKLSGKEIIKIVLNDGHVEVVSRYLEDISRFVANSIKVKNNKKIVAYEELKNEIDTPADQIKYTGWVGGFSGRKISGWISSDTSPNEVQTIIIEVGDYRSPPVRADEAREHLKSSIRENINLGFSFVVPSSIEIKPEDRIRVLSNEGIPTGLTASIDKEYNKFIAAKTSKFSSSKFPRAKQDDAILIWCPISISGLTTQLEQITQILKKEKVKYYISYHVLPNIDHPEVENWIDPKDIDSPKVVLYFERFVIFDRGFKGAFKIFYVNLDWLNDSFIGAAKVHADIVLAPVTYRQDFLSETFPNQKILYLPWPSAIEPREGSSKIDKSETTDKINVLYIGNDYSEASRKSPMAVVEAITQYTGDNLIFDLKFRSPLPKDIHARLKSHSCVRTIIDYSTDRAVISQLHQIADVSLIPNECEGNGLSILEAWAFDVVPAVLGGHPMIDVADDSCAFFIDCEQYGWREKTPVYRTTTEDIKNFFVKLDSISLNQRRAGVEKKKNELQARKVALHEVVRNLIQLGGIRNKNIRLQIESAHELDETSGVVNAQTLLFGPKNFKSLIRPTTDIDIIMTTSQRPDHFVQSLGAVAAAIDQSPYQHRLFLAIDGADQETMEIVEKFKDYLDVVMFTKSRSGLPFTWNSIRQLNDNYVTRSEKTADYLCYIQDDCLINDPSKYFKSMVEVADNASNSILGLVSGFHTEVHPGFATGSYQGHDLIYSDTIDGKNFMGRPRIFKSIMPLTWWFSDGMRRGNPGPIRGSHFDLWLWKESPNALSVQKRFNIIIPTLTSHIASDASASTWNNDTSDENTSSRISAGKIYATRPSPAKS